MLFVSCEKDNDESDNSQFYDGFDRSDLLINWCDNIILPSYNAFESSLLNLEDAINTFNSNPSILELESLSNSWLDAYKVWQHVEMFDIGYAETINYKAKINI